MKFFPRPEGMPRPLYLALTKRDHTASGIGYSVTGLLKPPRILQLERRYDDVIMIDARRNAKAVLGTAWHEYIERKARQYPEECEVVEELIANEVLVTVAGQTYSVTIRGRLDYHNTVAAEEGDVFALEHGTLWDYKTCSQWVIRYGPKDDWTAQMNIYAWMLRKRGRVVDSIKVCPLYTDWKKRDKVSEFALGDPIELPIWTDDHTLEFLKARIVLHEEAKQLADDELPECTHAERWMNVSWRVRKVGDAKFKVENFAADRQAAEARAEELGPDHIAFFVSDEPRRCNDWCACALFCSAYRREHPSDYLVQLETRLRNEPGPPPPLLLTAYEQMKSNNQTEASDAA